VTVFGGSLQAGWWLFGCACYLAFWNERSSLALQRGWWSAAVCLSEPVDVAAAGIAFEYYLMTLSR
jgi:hypothetical protein